MYTRMKSATRMRLTTQVTAAKIQVLNVSSSPSFWVFVLLYRFALFLEDPVELTTTTASREDSPFDRGRFRKAVELFVEDSFFLPSTADPEVATSPDR